MTVNGTEDVTMVWDAINWRLHEDNVRRLRRRIFTAVKEQDLAKARSLPHLNRTKARLSRMPRRVARPVLRGAGRSNALRLPDLHPATHPA